MFPEDDLADLHVGIARRTSEVEEQADGLSTFIEVHKCAWCMFAVF